MIEIPVLISIISVTVAIIVALVSINRGKTLDDKKEATEMTTLIVKLEAISSGVNEIKTDMRNIKSDIQDLRDRMIRVEQSTKSAHKRLDVMGAEHYVDDNE